MGFFKRAFYSMRYRKGQNIFLMIAYTAIFALTLAILLVYLSMSAQVDSLQKSLGCAVTLRGPGISTEERTRFEDIIEEDAWTFIDSPYVEDYNIVGWIEYADFEGFLPVVREENIGLYNYQTMDGTGKTSMYFCDCTMAPVTQSERFDAFTIYGYTLVEGRHFTAEDINSVIITTELAERNGIRVGDQLTFSTGNYIKLTRLTEDQYQYATLTVTGLMEPPDAKELGYDLGAVHMDPYNFVIASYDAASILTNRRAIPPAPAIQWVTVYLKSSDDLDAFLEEIKGKLTIERVAESQSDFGMKYISVEEGDALLDRYYGGEPFYDLYLDNEWYDIVAKPLESVCNLMGIFLAVVLVGSAAVLALVVLLSLQGRRREFGILFAMGESARKIIGQIFAEVFLPLLVAAVLGTILGTQVLVPMAEDYSGSLLFRQSREGQTDLRVENKELDHYYFTFPGESMFSADFQHRSSRLMAVVKSVPYEAGTEVYGAYFTLDFGMVILVLLVQMLSVLRVKPARILTGRE